MLKRMPCATGNSTHVDLNIIEDSIETSLILLKTLYRHHCCSSFEEQLASGTTSPVRWKEKKKAQRTPVFFQHQRNSPTSNPWVTRAPLFLYVSGWWAAWRNWLFTQLSLLMILLAAAYVHPVRSVGRLRNVSLVLFPLLHVDTSSEFTPSRACLGGWISTVFISFFFDISRSGIIRPGTFVPKSLGGVYIHPEIRAGAQIPQHTVIGICFSFSLFPWL